MDYSSFRELLAELKRRQVIRVAVVYSVVAFILVQVADLLVPALLLPDWVFTFVVFIVLLAFPVALILAWALEITPEGVRRTRTAAPATADDGGVERDAGVPAPSAGKVRSAALIALGMVIAVLGIGAYAYFQAPQAQEEGGPASGGELRFVAVLPFVNASPDAENEFFADGVMEDVLTHLAQVPEFAVPSRTTVMRYKGSTLSVPEIARELGVRYVLEGSVRRAEDRVRITAQLLDGPADQHLWAETYDRRLEDIFGVQTEIATAIAGALEAELTRDVAARIERRPTQDLEAYDLFLRGRESFYRADLQGTERAIAAFRAALERDPGFALARAWLGRAYAIYFYNHGAGRSYADSALAHSRRAVADQPDLAAAHSALGTALTTSGRSAEAREPLERAHELNPNDGVAIGSLGLSYAHTGRLDDAIRLTRLSLERDPARAQIALANLSSFYAQVGLMDEAEDYIVRALDLQPGFTFGVYMRGWLDTVLGRRDAALATADLLSGSDDLRVLLFAGTLYYMAREPERVAETLVPVFRANPGTAATHLVGAPYAWALLVLDREPEAREVLRVTVAHVEEEMALGHEGRWLPYTMVMVHALEGERDRAFALLADMVDDGWVRSDLLAWEPALDGLRDDPRMEPLAERMRENRRALRERVLRVAP
jgi:TolB-like protein/Tfp pilus assembly protein PilF